MTTPELNPCPEKKECLYIPLKKGLAIIPYPMSEESYELLVNSINLWKPRLVKAKNTRSNQ